MCKRSLKNISKTKRFHWLYMGSLITTTILVLVVTFASMLLNVSYLAMTHDHFPETQVRIALGVFALMSMTMIIGLAVLMAHRISGPHIKMIQVCNQVSGGNRSARIRFRKGDGLEDVEEAFNAMLDFLERK